MNWKRSLTNRIATIFVAATMIALAAGCHRKSADDFLAEGDADMQATKLADAETAYGEAEKLAPGDPRVHIALGNLYIFEHKPADAQVEFMKVLEIDPKNAATHVALGNLYSDQGQHGLAENQYRAAVALEPDRYNYHLDLGEVLRQEGKLAEAEDQIRTAIGLNPKDARSHLALANLLAAEPGRASEANAEFDEVRALDRQDAARVRRDHGGDCARGRRDCDRVDDRSRRADHQAAQQAVPVDEKFARLPEPRRNQLDRRPGAAQEVRSRHRNHRQLPAGQAQERNHRLHPRERGGVEDLKCRWHIVQASGEPMISRFHDPGIKSEAPMAAARR